MSRKGEDQREVPRIQPFVHSCRVREGERVFTGYLTDLSPVGARVACAAAAPAPGTAVELLVRFRPGQARTRLPGEVRWVQPPLPPATATAFGVTFLDLPAEAGRLIEAVLAEFRRRVSELG